MSHTFLLNTSVGEYRLEDFLGAGGMGEVYRGVHTKIGRVAAIKVLTVAARREQGFVERFFNEARIQASLQHPNIATLYDFMEFQGQPCIIMEYIDGQTLCDRVRPYGALHPAEALNIFAAVADAIAYIHGHGVIHRDIKSNNIKISTAGQVKLLDFGIAKGNMSPGLTETGSVVGTLEYISPEQLATGHADPRSDIWALGVLLYEMTTGRVPFEAQTLGALCDMIGRADYAAPRQLNPALPSEVAAIIARCLKKNPAERYQTAGALLQDVRRASASLSVPTPEPAHPHDPTGLRTTTHAPTDSWLARHWLKLSGVAVVFAVFAVFAAAGLYYALAGDANAPAPVNVNVSALASNSGARTKTIRVEMSDGPAEIWMGDKMLGVGQASVTAHVGDWVELRLRRDGQERTERFQMTENKPTWTLTFKKEQ
jgi:eukaryotic-like serine/threonine-protein kinase